MAEPLISVVVPTFRRPDLLDRCLMSLAEQTTPPADFEVVVVDDGSADDTARVLDSWATRIDNLVARVQPQNRGPAAARNVGIEAARAPLILFLDDDVAATPDLVENHVDLQRAAADPLLGILGRVDWHPDLDVTPFMRWLDHSGLQFAFDTWLREGPVDPPYAAFYTANLSMTKRLLVDAGGFDERFPYPAYEDLELAWRLSRAGFRMDYRPVARAFHARPIGLGVFAARMRMVAESAELIAAVQPEFPLDDSELRNATIRRRDLWAIRARAGIALLTRNEGAVHRRFRAEIVRAYHEGIAAGRARLANSDSAS